MRVAPLLTRRLLTAALVGATTLPRQSFAAEGPILFEADDKSFTFELPPRWFPATPADKERESTGHLIAVRAGRSDQAATVQAIVDGGFRGRKYGSSLSDLGPIKTIADGLVTDSLLMDDEAKSAAVVSAEKSGFGGSVYYIIRYQVGGKPAIAKLTVLQQRLYCVTVRATQPALPSFFDDEASPLLADMDYIINSYSVVPVNYPCLDASSKGNVPAAGVCRVLRP